MRVSLGTSVRSMCSASIRAQERRARVRGGSPAYRDCGQADPGRLPAGRGEISRLGAQAAAHIQDAAAARQPGTA
jgi:hypothetical protein